MKYILTLIFILILSSIVYANTVVGLRGSNGIFRSVYYYVIDSDSSYYIDDEGAYYVL